LNLLKRNEMSVDVMYTGEMPPPRPGSPEGAECVFRDVCPMPESTEYPMPTNYEVRCSMCDTVFRSRTQGTAVIQ
jgi:hypothetical protein